MKNFINETVIFDLLEEAKNPSSGQIEAIISKSLKLKGLSPEESAVLINCEDEAILNRVFMAATQIKDLIYGNRLVLFAPLY
ncbi:MAG: [FeFe] hydrogenase H-cluster radical SAM maturase HydG, partial [Proteobacteria bacterium]|nr:[FeFe] hydrogenase H-cluster radical SAM maturase HydG [Pseudomonadota bacterium]